MAYPNALNQVDGPCLRLVSLVKEHKLSQVRDRLVGLAKEHKFLNLKRVYLLNLNPRLSCRSAS
jgi:hypothetical protein